MTTTSGAAAPSHRVLVAISAIATFSFLVWVLWFCRFGIDFRDEGLYLVLMANPLKYDSTITQFGFIYHPLFEAVAQSVSGVRQLNLLITFALAWILADAALRSASAMTISRGPRVTVAAALATSSLSYLHIWLPTPSYNWLILQSLMLAGIGLLMAGKALDARSIRGWILLGIGGWLAFMAKPTSAAALAVCALTFLLASGRLALRPLLLCAAVAVALLLASAWAMDGSVQGFIERYRTGIELAGLLGGGHKLSLFLRLGELALDTRTRQLLWAGVVALAGIAWLAGRPVGLMRSAAFALAGLFGLGALAVVGGLAQGMLPIVNHRGLLWAIVPLAGLLLLAVSGRRHAASISRSRWSLIALLLVLPYVHVFGTSNDYWWQISQAAFFWVLAGAVLAVPAPTQSSAPPALLPVLVFGLAAQAVTAAVVQTGIEAPYGQAVSLREQRTKVLVGGHSLRLSKGFGAYLTQAEVEARRTGFVPGTPMLDLTGRSPTTLFSMGAGNASQAWMIGGYPGSDQLAQASVQRVSCDELARAWILVQPVGSTNISPDLLTRFGAHLESDYERVATLVMDETFSGYRERWIQHLWKPTRSPEAANAACLAIRSGEP